MVLKKVFFVISVFLILIIPLSLSQSADYTDYHIYEGYPDLRWDVTFLRIGYDDEQKEFITLIKFEQEYTTQIRATLVLNLRNSLNGNDLEVDVLPITSWPSTPISHNNQPSYGSLARSLIITPTQTSYTIIVRDLPANTKGIALRAGSVGNNEKIITIESLDIDERSARQVRVIATSTVKQPSEINDCQSCVDLGFLWCYGGIGSYSNKCRPVDDDLCISQASGIFISNSANCVQPSELNNCDACNYAGFLWCEGGSGDYENICISDEDSICGQTGGELISDSRACPPRKGYVYLLPPLARLARDVDKEEASSGRALFESFWKTKEEQVKDGVSDYNSVPQVYQEIASNYGHADADSFSTTHSDYIDSSSFDIINEPSELGVMSSKNIEFLNWGELERTSAENFERFLEQEGQGLLDTYQDTYRSCNLGGCYPMTDLSREVLKNVYGISSVKQSFPVHYYALVNVEGVVYYLDFAFNQFVEDSVTTHYGIPQGTGETTGIIVMPLGVDNGFIEELPEGEISVTDHTPPALTAVVSEPYEWGTTASTGDYIVYYTSETIGQIPIIGRPITEGVDIIVGGIEAVGDAAAYVWDFVLGKDEYSGEHTQLDSRGGGSIDSSYFAATTSENSYPDPTQNSALVHAVEVSSEHSDGNHISPDDIDPSPGWIGETWGSFKKWIVSLNEYPEGWLKTPYLTDRRYSPPGGLLREIPIDRSPRLCGDFYHEGNCLTNPNCIFAYGRITLPLCLPIRATGVRFFCEDIEDLESCQRVPNCVYLSGVGCVSSEYLGEDDCYMLNEEECTNKVERINGLCKRNLVRDSRGSWQSGFSAEEPWYCEPNPIDPYDPKTTDPNYYNPDQISTAIWDYDGPVSSDNYCFDVWDGNYCSGAYLLKCYGTQIGDRIYCENGCKHVPVQVGEGGNDRCNEAPKYTDGCRDRQSKGFYCHEGDKILCTDPIRPSVLGFKFFSDYYAQEKFRTYCILGCEYGKCNIGMSSMQQYCDPDSEYYKGADEFCLDDHYLTRCEERDNGGYIMPQTYCRYGCDDDGKCLTVWSGACNGKADGEYCAWNKLITCENGIAVDSDYCDKGCVEGACA